MATVDTSALASARATGQPWVVVAGRAAAPLASVIADAGFPVRAAAVSPDDVRDEWLGEAGAAVVDATPSAAALLRRWRSGGDRPVVFIAGEGDFDRLVEWRRPHDEFVLRPNAAAEVGFRLRIALARAGRGRRLILDHDTREAVMDDRRVALTRLEFAVLVHLADHPGHAFTRDDLLRAVWGSRSDWQQPSTVTEHVRRVRTKLDPDAPDRWIRTVHGVGYAFVG